MLFEDDLRVTPGKDGLFDEPVQRRTHHTRREDSSEQGESGDDPTDSWIAAMDDPTDEGSL